jgi:HEAT repeat protein
MNDSDSRVRYDAARALGEIGDPRATEPLIAALKNTDVSVRYHAAQALGEIKDPRALEPLIAALKDRDVPVRYHAARALGEIKDPRAVEPLIAALKDTDYYTDGIFAYYVRTGAAMSLGKIKDSRAVEPLIAAMKETNLDFRDREVPAELLAEFQDPRAVGALLAGMRKRDMAVIAGAYKFFIKRGDAGSEDALIEMLNGYPDADTVQEFLHSGNPKLEKAVRDLATSLGTRIVERPGEGYVRWGSGR